MSHPGTEDLFRWARGTGDLTAIEAHLAVCASCRSEAGVLHQTLQAAQEAVEEPGSAEADDRLLAAALGEGQPAATPAPRWQRPRLVMAAAAAVLVISGTVWMVSRPQGGGAVPVTARLGDGTTLGTLAEGSRLSGHEGQPLLADLGGSTRVTVEGGAVVQVVHARARWKELAVESGTAVFSVHGRKPDEEISVTTPRGTVHVTGTRFAVTVGSGGSTRVTVQEGHTRFTAFDGQEFALSQGGTLVAEDRGEEIRVATAEDLSAFADVPPAATVRPQATATAAPVVTPTAAVRPAASPTPKRRVTPTDAPSQSQAELLYSSAERDIASGRAAEAAATLENISTRFSGTPTAATALFELARLREDKLHDPSGAAAAYRQYRALGTATPLAPEALRGLCRVAPTDADCPAAP